MVRVESIRQDITRDKKVVNLQVSVPEELPELNENVEGIIIAAGSVAQIIRTGEWVTLDDDGTWYNSNGDKQPKKIYCYVGTDGKVNVGTDGKVYACKKGA